MAGGSKAATLKILGNNLDAKEKLDQIKEEADKLREDNPELTVKINRAQASAEMAVLKEQLKSVRDEALETGAAVDSIGKVNLNLGLGESLKALGIGGAAVAGLSAAVPVVASLGAAVVGVGSALAGPIVGLGIFGAVAKSAVTDVENANAANKTLSGGLGELQTGLKVASGSWQGFVSKSADGVAKTLAPALKLVPELLKDAQGFLGPIESSLDGLVGKLAKAFSGNTFQGFLGTLQDTSGDVLTSLGDTLGHLGSIAMKVVTQFAPLGAEILDVVDKLSAKADAGANSGIQKFLGFVSAHGPDVINVLKNLGSSAVSIGKGLGGLSGVSLPILNALSAVVRVVASNPIGADALAGLLVLTKLGQVGALLGPMVKLIGLVKEFEVVQKALGAVSAVSWGPVGLAIVGIVAVTLLLVTHWKQVSAVAKTVFHDVLSVIDSVFGWVKKNWPLLLGILLGPIATATVLIITHWKQIESGAESLLGKLESFFKGLPGKILGALGDLGRLLWNAGVSIISGLFGGLEQKFNDVKKFVGGIASWISDHKGPISYDATLLKPHGLAIMGGLVGGLDAGMPALTHQLARTTQTIATTKTGGLAAPGNGAVQVTLEIQGGADQTVITALKKLIRVRGGDPTFLGR